MPYPVQRVRTPGTVPVNLLEVPIWHLEGRAAWGHTLRPYGLHGTGRVNAVQCVMRTFVSLRSLLASHAELTQRLDHLECRYDDQFRCVFDATRDLMQPADPPRNPIGFQE